MEKVKALLKENLDLVSSIDRHHHRTPLHLAAAYGHKEVAELLLANKAEVNAKTKEGFYGDYKDVTPLHLAVMKRHKDVVELLLANQADVNARANDRLTPLRFAVMMGLSGIAEFLRQHGGHE